MMGRKAGPNRSGLDFENTVASQLRGVFDDARRLGTDAHGDVMAGPLLVECKVAKAPPSVRGAFMQAHETNEHDYKGEMVPAAVCRTKGDPGGTLITMRFSDFLQLLTDARDGRRAW